MEQQQNTNISSPKGRHTLYFARQLDWNSLKLEPRYPGISTEDSTRLIKARNRTGVDRGSHQGCKLSVAQG